MSMRVPFQTLKVFISHAFQACGTSPTSAETLGSLMAEADLLGQDGHGVFRLPQYIARIRDGGMAPDATITTVQERSATALLDGGNGPGHLVMAHAAELAMEKAATTGIAWVGARFSNHAGPACLYACKPLRRDMIGLYVAVGSANHMAPWGGTDLLLSTNPIAVAIPAKRHPPIILDMATTVAAYGKVKTLADRGGTMPVGWMIDRQGAPLTDPSRSREGLLLPIGGPKGYGLSLIFGILAGTLNGAAFGRSVVDFNADTKSVTNTGQFIIALSIEAFADVEDFKESIDTVIDEMKSSSTLPNVDEVRVPGERLSANKTRYLQEGIPISAPVAARLEDMANTLGIPHLTKHAPNGA